MKNFWIMASGDPKEIVNEKMLFNGTFEAKDMDEALEVAEYYIKEHARFSKKAIMDTHYYVEDDETYATSEIRTMYKEDFEQYLQKIRIFVDMDGVLAKFQYVDTLETLYEEGYFRNLPPQENVVEAIRLLTKRKDADVYILSAVLSDSSYALKEKNEWLDEYLPEIDERHRIFPPCGKDKKRYIPCGATESDCLLDDYTYNLTDWEPPAHGIKLLNGINHTKGTWQGDMVGYNIPPANLEREIYTAAKSRMHVRVKSKLRR